MMTSFVDTLRSSRRARIIAGAVVVLVAAGGILFFLDSVNRRVSLERGREAESSRIEIQERKLRAPATDGLTTYLDSSDARAVAAFEGTRYLATSGGLIAIDDAGNVKRRYSTVDGLPDNDLTVLAVFRERLFVGSATAGLIAFDGNAFTSYEFVKPKATSIGEEGKALELGPKHHEAMVGVLEGAVEEVVQRPTLPNARVANKEDIAFGHSGR